MFTGIVEIVGKITSSRPVSGGRRLSVDAGPIAGECALGASVCVSGVCLTVAGISGNVLEFDVITETLETSTLGNKSVGNRVNLERSLQLGGRLEGHFVQGHVDGRATVARVQKSPSEFVLWLNPDPSLTPYVIPKGSVAVDGVSLTIAAIEGDTFSVALIPTTLDLTTLSSVRTGEVVNIESDIITRTIVHRLSKMSDSGGVTLDALRQAGFA